ncbi:MAG TPA: hypothetical protein VFU15_03755, partial [Bacteroidia bacterium]|nr:hypothetical protein [Bacteroidia bacterium]
MRISGELEELVSTLSKPEKRHIQLTASMHGGEKNYVKLLSELTKKNPKKKKQKKKAGDPDTRRYLFSLVLKSIGSYYPDKSIDAEINELLISAEVLLDRNMMSARKKILDRAKRMAYRYAK